MLSKRKNKIFHPVLSLKFKTAPWQYIQEHMESAGPSEGSALLAVLSEARLLFRALGLDEFAVKTCDIAQ